MPKLKDNLAHVRFIAKITKMGEKLIIIIPMDYHEEVETKALRGKQVRVRVDDEF